MAIPNLQPDSSFKREVAVLGPLTFLCVFFRCCARLQTTGVRQLKVDDWGMKVAVVMFAFTGAAAQLIAVTTTIDTRVNPNNIPVALDPALANNGMSAEYRAKLDPASVEYQLRIAGSKLHLSAWSLYVSSLWCLKLCIAVFYTRLTDGIQHMRIRIQIAYVAIGVTYVVVMATLLGACQPFHHFWQINPDPGDQCHPATSKLTCSVVVVCNVLTDLYLLHIPILMLWGARISRIKKFFLIVLFSGGFFVIMAAILRAYFILTDSVTGGAQAAGWGVREIFVAFFIGNVPMIYGGLRLWLHSFKESKVYARIRARTRDWPGANRFSALFGSRTPWSSGRHGGNASSGNRTLAGDEVGGPNIAMAKTTDPASRPSLLPWGHSRTASRIDTNIKRSDTERGVTDPTGFGIQVTRGIHVDVESVKRRESDGLQSFETVAGKEPSRTGSEAQLGPLMTESPSKPASARGQVSELPSGPHQEKEKKTILQIPKDVRSREQRTSDGPNDTKWIADDSP